MAGERLVFIVNPVSGGGGRGRERAERLRSLLARRRRPAEVWTTEHTGHGRELAARALAEGAGRIVAVGGDGTMNEVAAPLLGRAAAFGLIPTGSGNGLASHLGLPMEFEAALDVALGGRERTIDAGTVNGRPFLNVMGAGFDAEIGHLFNRAGTRGLWSYIRAGLRAWSTYPLQDYELANGTGPVPLRALIVAVANSTQYGNGARIAPQAEVDDGLLDLVAITSRRTVDALGLAVRLFAGRIDRSPHVRVFRSGHFTLRRRAPGRIHTDGEAHEEAAELEVQSLPGALRVVVPAGA